jgi:hypothetical protein
MPITRTHPNYLEYIALKNFLENSTPSVAAIQVIKTLGNALVVDELIKQHPNLLEVSESFEYPSTRFSIESCLKLLEIYPRWELSLFRLALQHPIWRYVMQNWQKMCNAYKSGNKELFNSIVDKIEAKYNTFG